MSIGASGMGVGVYVTAGYCENPHEDPARMPRAGDAGEWLAFVPVLGQALPKGSPTLFLGGVVASPGVQEAPQALYLNHAFEATILWGFYSGIVRGVLNGRMGKGVPDPKVRLQVTEFNPYGRQLLPFEIPIGWYVDLKMATGKVPVVTYLNLPLTWDS